MGQACSLEPHYLIPLGMPRKDGYFLELAGLSSPECLGSNLFAKPMLSKTWLTTKSKCPGFGMVAKLMLPWTSLNAKFMYLGSSMFTGPTLPHPLGRT
jgi:hypothetical protein